MSCWKAVANTRDALSTHASLQNTVSPNLLVLGVCGDGGGGGGGVGGGLTGRR